MGTSRVDGAASDAAPRAVDPAGEAIAVPEHPTGAPELAGLLDFWERATDLLAIADVRGTFLHVNPAWTRALGWSREELLAFGPLALVPSEDLPATEAVLSDLARSGASVEGFTNRLRARSGALRTLRWNLRADADGRMHAVAHDVTDALRREEQLRESEERFRLAMTHAAVGMALVTPDGTCVEVNDALCRLLARPRDVLTVATFQELTHPDDLDADLELLTALSAGEIERYDLEKRYLRPDGTVVWGLLSVSALRDEDGAPRYYISQVQDVTPQRRAQQQLEETLGQLRRSNETLTDFAAIAAHDLKSPLAVSASLLDLLSVRFGTELPPQARELAERARQQVLALGRQVDGLLRLASVPAMTLHREPLDVAALVDEVADRLGDTLGGLRITVEPCPLLHADRSALGLLLQNLLENAARHGARAVWVRPEHPDAGADSTGATSLCVDDDGPGIPVEEREAVFEVFGRGSASRGSGIGLSTCRQVIERHGGRIGLGEAPEGGLRVCVTLP